MPKFLLAIWREVLRPMIQRPKRLQVAALCHRDHPDGRQVLLVTSRGTGRWIIPKGWPIRGLLAPETALQEAWEEAGVCNSKARAASIGTYRYDKVLSSGLAIPIETMVYAVKVDEMADKFPESSARKRQWFSPEKAADLVRESELKAILRAF